ncbi:MAG: hypothetical protein AAFY88_06030 [Acidobacteriota bacterium]
MGEGSDEPAPRLGGVVVHWRDEEGLARLLGAWPRGYPLVVVDNSRDLEPAAGGGLENVEIHRPEVNLGFGGGVNRGALRLTRRAPTCRFLLILNPDAAPVDDAVEALERACFEAASEDPACAGLAPALLSPDGSRQFRWQLQPLPTASTLLAQVFFAGGARGPRTEPPPGARCEQPAAAVLALDLERLGALRPLFDDGFYPAWFDDVDLAKRVAGRRLHFRYAPVAQFHHAQGGSVPALGYGRFLWIYYRNLLRYLRKHHGAGAAALARVLLPISMGLRLLLLPLRSPRRATSRVDAARGLLAVLVGAAGGWRRPRAWAERFRQPETGQGDRG